MQGAGVGVNAETKMRGGRCGGKLWGESVKSKLRGAGQSADTNHTGAVFRICNL